MSFCQRTISHFNTILTPPQRVIGIHVEGGGCNGLKYGIEPMEREYSGGELLRLGELNVSVCPKSLMYLIGTHVEWEETAMSKGLVFQNPNAKAQCGCGSTFTP